MRTQTRDIQQDLTPPKALDLLAEGNRRFVKNLRYNRDLLEQVNETSEGQYPFAIVLSCIDSRTGAELIFDQGLGDIFSVRVAGNVINDDVLASMEFACQVAGSRLVVVMGHTRCGAVTGACSDLHLGHLTALLGRIAPAVREVKRTGGGELPEAAFIDRVALENTRQQMHEILERSPVLAELFAAGKIGIAGAIYAVESGEVTFFEQAFQTPAPATPRVAAR